MRLERRTYLTRPMLKYIESIELLYNLSSVAAWNRRWADVRVAKAATHGRIHGDDDCVRSFILCIWLHRTSTASSPPLAPARVGRTAPRNWSSTLDPDQ